ncbi:TPA: helix-turn-helix domain-containing protein [Candidatus Bathyarchaeota archaeon]|nr:helix-turn-helix domain-containing protein [Candidatus Bathyarchaeota archaeon]
MVKMAVRCEVFVKKLLPAFRSLIAKELIEKYNFSQIEAAAKLGITQAAVSQYFHSKRGYKEAERLEALIKPMIEEAARRIAESEKPKIEAELCRLCKALCK